MAAPHQPPTSTPTTQPQQPPVELDSHPIAPPPAPSSSHQPSAATTTTTSTTDDSGAGRRPSIYEDPESMAKLRAERSVDPAVVDDPGANEPAAEDFAVAAGLEGEGEGVGRDWDGG